MYDEKEEIIENLQCKGKKLKKFIKSTLASSVLALISACGGGGGDVSGGSTFSYSSGENITYITQNGLKWSSPSTNTYIYSSGFNSIEKDANSYCSQTTSTNGGAAVPTNFNSETGWGLPTEAQMTAFRVANSSPTGWQMVNIWFQPSPSYTGSLNTYINYGTGVTTYANASAKAHVVCVKAI